MAQKAVKSLNETEFFGRNVRLDIANGPPSGGGGVTPRGRGMKIF